MHEPRFVPMVFPPKPPIYENGSTLHPCSTLMPPVPFLNPYIKLHHKNPHVPKQEPMNLRTLKSDSVLQLRSQGFTAFQDPFLLRISEFRVLAVRLNLL